METKENQTKEHVSLDEAVQALLSIAESAKIIEGRVDSGRDDTALLVLGVVDKGDGNGVTVTTCIGKSVNISCMVWKLIRSNPEIKEAIQAALILSESIQI